MTKEFFDDPRRGYGPSIGTVFSKLKNSGFNDIYGPAKEQFKGQGSCGNGSAMRISPVGLFGYKDGDALVKVYRYQNVSVMVVNDSDTSFSITCLHYNKTIWVMIHIIVVVHYDYVIMMLSYGKFILQFWDVS